MNFTFWFIFFSQIAFWFVLFAGFITRYLFKKQRASSIVLYVAVAIDAVLLYATALNIKNGTFATIYHGLSAVFIGVALCCGPSLLAWIDNKFKPADQKELSPTKTLTGKPLAKYKLKQSVRHLYAFCLGSILLVLAVLFIDNSHNSKGLTDVINIWLFIIMLDFLYSLTFYFWPKKT
ncbi:hypothetical protein ACJYYY_05110 [Brochothrix campestris]|uniref:hypothetical protein n=1 Tax=Brochothrix campestris TaxID=2757 RepID=UPI0038CF8948